jgi:hypothetical protein
MKVKTALRGGMKPERIGFDPEPEGTGTTG